MYILQMSTSTVTVSNLHCFACSPEPKQAGERAMQMSKVSPDKHRMPRDLPFLSAWCRSYWVQRASIDIFLAEC